MRTGHGDNDRREELYRFLEEEWPGTTFDGASDALRLDEDLGLYGDEAIDFLLKLSERFNVDLTQFDLAAHFYPEDSLRYGFRRLFGCKRELKASPSIKDLRNAIATGELK